MGYHYQINSLIFPETASPSDQIELNLEIENVGVAPIYRPLPLIVRLFSKEGSHEFKTEVDIRNWLPGKTEEIISLALPKDIPAGSYDIEIAIHDPKYPQVFFCTDAEMNGIFYKLGNITIE